MDRGSHDEHKPKRKAREAKVSISILWGLWAKYWSMECDSKGILNWFDLIMVNNQCWVYVCYHWILIHISDCVGDGIWDRQATANKIDSPRHGLPSDNLLEGLPDRRCHHFTYWQNNTGARIQKNCNSTTKKATKFQHETINNGFHIILHQQWKRCTLLVSLKIECPLPISLNTFYMHKE